jgi:CRP-like cAMP-binding protein
MNYELLLDSFKRHVHLSEADKQVILSLVTERTFKRGQFITSEGEVNHYTNFITSGSTRVFYIDHNGHEHIIQLGISGWWTGDFVSYIMQQPGFFYTEALESTELLCFSYDNLQIIYERVPVMERFFRLLIQRAYAAFQQRVLHNLSMDAEARYLAFRNAYPEMEQHLAQKHIASYLGMSAEFLSKIKKRIVIKERNKLR